MNTVLEKIGYRLAGYLSESGYYETQETNCTEEDLKNSLQKGDVLLFEGTSRISAARF